MILKQLEEEALKELETEKVALAKEVLKERISEIAKTKAVLNRLETQYANLLEKSVEDVADEAENGNICL